MPDVEHLMPLFVSVAVMAESLAPAQMARPVSGSASGGAQWVEEREARGECSVRVVFGSFATGPDTAAMRIINRLVADDRAVTAVTRSPYGREGEHSLCIRTTSPSAATRLFNALESAVCGPVAAPVTIVGPARTIVVPTGT